MVSTYQEKSEATDDGIIIFHTKEWPTSTVM